jgi:hypothetical protein
VADATLSAVVALDVFDQNGVNIEAALSESRRVLRNGGKLILRVSAYPWLQGQHDAAFNTARRYYRQEMAALLAAHNFQIERLTHANTLLAPPVILMRLLQRWRVAVGSWQLALSHPRGPSGRATRHPLPAVYHDSLANQIFAQALRLEAGWLATLDLPFGISLYAVAAKVTG